MAGAGDYIGLDTGHQSPGPFQRFCTGFRTLSLSPTRYITGTFTCRNSSSPYTGREPAVLRLEPETPDSGVHLPHDRDVFEVIAGRAPT